MEVASNQCCHIAHTMKQTGYLTVKYQKNLKRLLGYETIEKLEEIYPFK